ncbi:SH3 domain-containing protein [Mangrovimonas sp. TPBH4]|uniref:SH3 domain-containing protein n=1 Tax=Mangrovimonas sp. TPBH4 TaxID=1645914 RepID=UPI0006B45F06|nr:SH3 domain-containing protein [Mangrovimonas sp. TPBH4]
MKNIFLLVLLCISTLAFRQNTKFLSKDYQFENGDIAYMFGDDVKLRSQPNTESEVLALLKIGESIEIIEKTEETMIFEGIEWPWYKIKFQDHAGYVLGGLIALDKATYNNLTYLISLKEEERSLYAKTRLAEEGKPYLETSVLLSTDTFAIKAFGNRGLENTQSIFLIDYLAEACGVDGGGIYLFYDGNALIEGFEYTEVSDAGVYWYVEEYIFPTDENGHNNRLKYRRTVGEYKDETTYWTESTTTTRLLEWKNNQLVPKIEVQQTP